MIGEAYRGIIISTVCSDACSYTVYHTIPSCLRQNPGPNKMHCCFFFTPCFRRQELFVVGAQQHEPALFLQGQVQLPRLGLHPLEAALPTNRRVPLQPRSKHESSHGVFFWHVE